ncbi:MAG: formylglycine-generating enzyme family protein [Verrucomicrobia bacterium]|nr:formylglycine-generating enzyme family protein [Verrucomicrobiota bacterium]
MIPPDEIIPSRRHELTRYAGGSPIITGMVDDLLVIAIKSGEQTPTTLGPTVGSPWTVPYLSLEMLWCKPGAFQMGSPEDEKNRCDDETLHEVTLTSDYWLGKHPVTQAQWEKEMGNNPSHFKGANRPVEEVAWDEVTSFCEKLTELEREAGRLPAGMTYQLPTEAEWEYACRAGTTTRFAFGDELTEKDANFGGNVGETTDVGKHPANAWGFHDMHGNVWEWCADWFEDDYPTGNVTDPTGPAVGSFRVYRGGSWSYTANIARSASRCRLVPALRHRPRLGFRLSLRPASKAEPQVQVQEKESVAVSVNAGTAITIRDLGLDMLWVKPGTFEMGSPPEEEGRLDDRETQHTVTLTEGYWLGKHPVTQAEWEKVMGNNPSHFKGANRPVEKVSWDEVTSFCEKRTELERKAGRLPAGMAYQLPTEAQWEYACRAEMKTAFSFGDSLTSDQANIRGGPDETTDVGKYPANPWGFHDMHGNVWEWCADWYEKFTSRAVSDPVGPAGGSARVLRGGAWHSTADSARSAIRSGFEPAFSFSYLGFRLSLRPASQ